MRTNVSNTRCVFYHLRSSPPYVCDDIQTISVALQRSIDRKTPSQYSCKQHICNIFTHNRLCQHICIAQSQITTNFSNIQQFVSIFISNCCTQTHKTQIVNIERDAVSTLKTTSVPELISCTSCPLFNISIIEESFCLHIFFILQNIGTNLCELNWNIHF